MQANHPSNTELLATGSDTNFARALAVLLVAVTWLFLPRLASPFDVKRQVASLGAIAAVLLFVARSPRCWRMPGGSAGTALALFISAAILSAAVAGNGYLSAAQLAQLLPFLALLLCLFNLREADAATTRIEDGMLIAALGVALFGLKQWLLPAWLDPGFNALGKLKIYSTLGNPNLAAFVLLCALPIAFLRGSRGNTPQRIAYATVALLLMGCLLATQSRHALLIALALMPIGDFRLTLYTTPVIDRLRAELFADKLWQQADAFAHAVQIEAMLTRLCAHSLGRISAAIVAPAMDALGLASSESCALERCREFFTRFEALLSALHVHHLESAENEAQRAANKGGGEQLLAIAAA
jgi:hypothetical protein